MKHIFFIAVITIIAVLFGIGISSIIYSFNAFEYSKMYSVKVEVSNISGFNVENSSLNFGNMIPNSAGKRFIDVKNNNKNPVRAFLTAEGDISSWISVEPIITIAPESERRIEISLRIPANASLQKYKGKLNIAVKK